MRCNSHLECEAIDRCQPSRSAVTNRSPMLAIALMAVALQPACYSQDPRSPAARDAPCEPPAAQAGDEGSITVHRAQPKVMRAVKPHSPVHGPSPSDSMEIGYLKAEVKYIGQDGIEASEVEQVLQTRDAFSSAVQAIDEEGIRNLEAQDMTRHVRTVMLQALGEDMTVHSLSCGLSICMGSVQRGSAFDDTWAHPFLDHGVIKVYGFVDATDRIADLHERRFLFSMDPELPGIIVPRAL